MKQASAACLLAALCLLAPRAQAQKGLPGPGLDSPRATQAREASVELVLNYSGELPPEAQLAPHFHALRQPGAGLALRAVRQSPAGRHLLFAQTHVGLPVEGGWLKLNLDANGRCYSALATWVPVGQPLGAHGASQASTQFAQSHFGDTAARAVAIWLPVPDGRLRAAYSAYGWRRANGRSETLFFDGQTGALLETRDETAYHAPADTNGRARVFLPDPLTTAEVGYGGAYTDQSDAAVPALDAQRRWVRLRNILRTGGTYRLEGPHVALTPISGREDGMPLPVVRPDSIFDFSRSESGFEDAMIYHHIDTFQRRVQALGYPDIQNAPLAVDAHYLSEDNSFFSPAGNHLAFGLGGVDDAEDADVIIHEYGHALSESAAPGTNNGLERRGLDEGIGDYLATSYSRQLNPFGWERMFSWDGHNPFWPGRPGNSSQSYVGFSPASFYAYGSLWCGFMMQVWERLGAEVTDKIQLQALFLNAPNMTLRDAAIQLIKADSLLYGSAHRAALTELACGRGLLSPARCTDAAPPTPGAGSFTLANPARGTLRGTAALLAGDSWVLTVVDMQGRRVGSARVAATSFDLPLPGLAQGLYLVRGEGPRGQIFTQKIVWLP